MKAHLVYNPAASGTDSETPQQILETLLSVGFDPVYRPTADEDDLYRVLDAVEDGLVVVAGGDGTVRAVVERALGLPMKMTILPLGGTNNIATTLGMTGDLRDLLAGLSDPRRRSFDVGRLQLADGERLFLEGAGCGLFGNAFAAFQELEEDGGAGSGEEASQEEALTGGGFLEAMGNAIPAFDNDGDEGKDLMDSIEAALAVLNTQEPFRASVTVDGETFDGEFLSVEVMNTPVIGPNIELAPDADPGDGRLDVVCIGPDAREELKVFLESFLGGEVREAPSVETVRGEEVRLAWCGLPLHHDARVFPVEEGTELSVSCQLHSDSIEVWIPRQGEEV
jgi:diacylglycerol kinase family enzyme